MERELLGGKIVREIIAQIASGIYEGGKRLPAERKLSETFSVSRGTIRQALADLEKIGVISIKPGSGAYVNKHFPTKIPDHILLPRFNEVTIRDVLIARKAIEVTAIDLACDSISEDQLTHISEVLQKMQAALDNLPDFLRLDQEFHESIVRASGNVVLVIAFEAISEYHKFSQVFSSLYADEEEKAFDFHQQIYSGLREGNKEKAQDALIAHLDYIDRQTSVGLSDQG